MLALKHLITLCKSIVHYLLISLGNFNPNRPVHLDSARRGFLSSGPRYHWLIWLITSENSVRGRRRSPSPEFSIQDYISKNPHTWTDCTHTCPAFLRIFKHWACYTQCEVLSDLGLEIWVVASYWHAWFWLCLDYCYLDTCCLSFNCCQVCLNYLFYLSAACPDLLIVMTMIVLTMLLLLLWILWPTPICTLSLNKLHMDLNSCSSESASHLRFTLSCRVVIQNE